MQHVIVKHSSWFVTEYGSLAVWSTQGMEKSHYVAKMAFSKHTQHDGTKKHCPSIVQTFQWWYRIIQEKEEQKEREKMKINDPAFAIAQELAEKRRQASLLSMASGNHAEWLRSCVREGRKWNPSLQVDEEGDTDASLNVDMDCIETPLS